MDHPPNATEAVPTPTMQQEPKPAKEKKPRTEAQQQATQKALTAMTVARKERAKQQIEKKAEVKEAVKIVKEKIYKDKVGFVTQTEYESTKSGLMKEIAELKGMVAMRSQYERERPAAPKQERIVERVIERVPTAPAPLQKLTGTALLDSIFFNK